MRKPHLEGSIVHNELVFRVPMEFVVALESKHNVCLPSVYRARLISVDNADTWIEIDRKTHDEIMKYMQRERREVIANRGNYVAQVSASCAYDEETI